MNRWITSKTQMYELLWSGELGNAFPVWQSIEAFERSGFQGLTGVRCADSSPGSPCRTHLSPEQAIATAREFSLGGHQPIIYEASPDDHLTIQGEFGWYGCLSDGRYGWDTPLLWLRYSRAKTHMRAALEEDNNYMGGRRAEVFLRHHLGLAGWADMLWLSMIYEGHAFEFSAYDISVGVEGKPYVLWEVRGY